MEKCSGHKTIALLNKSDLKTQVTEKDIKDHLDAEVISFSAKDQTGLENLEERIRDMFFSGSLDMNQKYSLTTARQKHALQDGTGKSAAYQGKYYGSYARGFLFLSI